MELVTQESRYNSKRITIAVAFCLVLITAALFYANMRYSDYKATTPATESPYIIQFKDDTADIPYAQLTSNRTKPDAKESSLVVRDLRLGIHAPFKLYGFYKNTPFQRLLWERGKNIPTMFITTSMNPNDDVIEGYILEDIIDGAPIAYIYVDEDWKKQIGESYILWGREFEHVEKITYTEVGKGIYMQQITDDRSRFDVMFDKRYGGIVITNMPSISDVKTRADDAIGIYLR